MKKLFVIVAIASIFAAMNVSANGGGARTEAIKKCREVGVVASADCTKSANWRLYL